MFFVPCANEDFTWKLDFWDSFFSLIVRLDFVLAVLVLFINNVLY